MHAKVSINPKSGMQTLKVSINPKSDMQTLKVHKDLFKKGYVTQGDIYCYFLLILDFDQQHSLQPWKLGFETVSSAIKGSVMRYLP